jgi:hypothetical protein
MRMAILNRERIVSVHGAESPMLPIRPFLAAGLLALAAPAFAPRAFAQSAPDALPAPPSVPARIGFADELAGRRLLFSAYDAYRNAPALRYSVRWATRLDRGTRTRSTSGVETIAAEPKSRRLALTMETTTAGSKEIRRVIAGGDALLATRYRARPGGAAPAREFVRLPLGPDDTLPRALRQVQAMPGTRAAEMALLGQGVRGTVWRGASDVVLETEPARQQRYADTGANFTVTTINRYLLDPKTHLLRRFEQWVSHEAGNRAARDPRNAYPRLSYRREDYDARQTAAAPLPAALFRQAPPPGYKETALPDAAPLAARRGPQEADAQSRRLLQRWTRAQERLLTYSAQIEVSERQEQNPDPAAAPLPERARNEDRLLYTVWLHRPGRVRLTEETPSAAQRRARSLLAVSDGKVLSVLDQRRPQPRTRALNAPDALAAALNQSGFGNGAALLDWLLDGPDLEADRAAYRGRQTLENGETVDVVELTRTQVARPQARRTTEVTRTTTVFLGADGLPRRIEERQARDVVGLLARDQPGDQVTTIRYGATRVDEQPPLGTFELPRAEQ